MHVQALSELCYRHGMLLLECGVQLSDVSKPVRTRVRMLLHGGRTVIRTDMGGKEYTAPRSSIAAQLAITAPERWPEFLATGAGAREAAGGGGAETGAGAAAGTGQWPSIERS